MREKMLTFERWTMRTSTKIFALLATVVFWTMAFAQTDPTNPEIPDLYKMIFSEVMLGQIAAVITTTKLIRVLLGGIKGVAALVLTIAVGLGVGFFQFSSEVGLVLSLVVGLAGGLASAMVFKSVKFVGGKDGQSGLSGLLSKVSIFAKLLKR